mmetsp:Transcript_9100/g.40055  ORF Transcript_9100/g.40055 Transcript_9100/m.40055 type:complete len:235 (+) Transcript_9100:1382-2086(+)
MRNPGDDVRGRAGEFTDHAAAVAAKVRHQLQGVRRQVEQALRGSQQGDVRREDQAEHGEGTFFVSPKLQRAAPQRFADALHRRHRDLQVSVHQRTGRTRRLVSVHLPGGWTQAVPRRGRHVRIQVVDHGCSVLGGCGVQSAHRHGQVWPRADVRRARRAGVRQGPTLRAVAQRVLPVHRAQLLLHVTAWHTQREAKGEAENRCEWTNARPGRLRRSLNLAYYLKCSARISRTSI